MRIEKDAVGSITLNDEFYGVQTKRALINFNIFNEHVDLRFIYNVVRIKKCCIITNYKDNTIKEEVLECVLKAINDILEHKYDNEFPTCAIQGGAGTSINMNVNEVISNVALKYMNKAQGEYSYIHPNDIINKCQSTNDVIPSALHITLISYIDDLIKEINALIDDLKEKAYLYKDTLKMARTQLEDAVPMTFGEELNAYASGLKRNVKSLLSIRDELHELNLGASACGTAINVSPYYFDHIMEEVSLEFEEEYYQADDLFDATSNVDIYVKLSGVLKSLAVNLSKMANDIRLLASGPITGLCEINIPARQNGSSIMPGKINPVIPEVMNQIAFNVMGNDTAITFASEAGQLELNAFLPLISFKLIEDFTTLTNGIKTLDVNCIKGIIANEERMLKNVETSAGISTVLCPYIGYNKASLIAHKAIDDHKTVKDIVIEDKLLSEEELQVIMNPMNITMPHHLTK